MTISDPLGPAAQVLPEGSLVPGQQEAELGEAGAVAAAGAPRGGGQSRGDAGHDTGLRRHVETFAAGLAGGHPRLTQQTLNTQTERDVAVGTGRSQRGRVSEPLQAR